MAAAKNGASSRVDDLKGLPPEELAQRLETSLDKGLSGDEARKRLERYGPNEVLEKEASVWARLLKRFWGPIPWMIEVAALLSALVGKWEDFAIITVLLLVNAGVDFWQESKAISALKVLQQKLARKARVLRDGRWVQIEVRELVPGDVIRLRIGDLVPADAVLADEAYLQVDQSALTGESLPVNKKTGDPLYSGSVIKQGEARAIVVATGPHTYFGRTVALVAKAEREARSHFQQAVVQIGDALIVMTVALVLIILIAGLFRQENLLELLRFALVLTVASIPVALPAVLTVTMAVGALELARRQTIVRRLAAIEELAGVDVLAADKTGTLTQNRMTIERIRPHPPFEAADVIFYALLASREENHDPIEEPIFAEAKRLSLDRRLSACEVTDFVPFDPIHKRTEATAVCNGRRIWVAKGAPQVILGLCEETLGDEEAVNRTLDELAQNGFRVLGVALREEGEKTRFVGLIPLYDPPRPDSAQVIAEARRLGLDVKMITGDHVAIARYIARVLGIGDRILDVRELREAGMKEWQVLAEVLVRDLYAAFKPGASEAEVRRFVRRVVEDLSAIFEKERLGTVHRHESEIVRLVEESDGFAQVFPEDKHFIVEKLQKAGHIVAMTGDGVNDAPALKKADCGIAVEGATDAARAAADLVLLAPGLGVIVRAVELARVIFERMKSYAIYRVTETVRVVLLMWAAITFFNFYPVTPLMIIILALLNDLPILAIAYDNAKVARTPVRWNMHEVLTVAGWLGLAGVLSSFLLFYLTVEVWRLPHDLIQTIFFLKLVVAGHGTIYNTRTYDRWFWSRPYPSAVLFGATFSTRVLGTFIGVYGWFFGHVMTPAGWGWGLGIWAYSLAWFVFNDAVKVSVYRYLERRGLVQPS
ncbi:MAG TPA: plasma-membrane proton-efflux P-type ATPase [Oceanithermus profundus]|uniref:Plasma-membrane proton-efflux P-type ATPase n=1 Tax=Oceanithermus profundus TaxID=187137 RepID=A0A7C4ZFG5_9DEIN|nr:plasma-membrane proton-efflux P-type ATPase [Oceanithermus profundus]